MQSEAIRKYRDLLEQGMTPSQAAAHVKIELGVKLPDTWRLMIEQGRPLPRDTF